MSANKISGELLGHIDKTLLLLSAQQEAFQEFVKKELPLLGKGRSAGMLTADYIADYYTCAETLFFRISQFFENSLPKDRWHSELLKKMTLTVPGIREQVISDATAAILDEFLRFRHFRRYYFKPDYDWDRLDYLSAKFTDVHPKLASELLVFRAFVESLFPS
ncbi:MAG: hypothetical protein A2293_07380 [Elusimicrobia bacterium RIFOXYB2_FULL_49_7]|nr:MAG: hypothetical protein A2293_07380 [Elusimicrobia bacterium RIFOXYB2_FULL_49_7]